MPHKYHTIHNIECIRSVHLKFCKPTRSILRSGVRKDGGERAPQAAGNRSDLSYPVPASTHQGMVAVLSLTFPNTTWRPSSQAAFAVVTKN